MAYLQITLKCNMHCQHCCYSCSMRGKQGDYGTIIKGIQFARDRGDETISIGGGEPTMHPDFFRFLKYCLEEFTYVWMATNGSQTKVMWRLRDILNGDDYNNVECDCSEDDKDSGYCNCYDSADIINQENKLGVALSVDYWHSAIDPKVREYWIKQASAHHRSRGYEVRDVSIGGAAEQGRSKKTGAGWGKHCVCPDLVIKPDGKIKLCGCTRSPIIGDVLHGIEEKWERIIRDDEHYHNDSCYRSIGGKRKKENRY